MVTTFVTTHPAVAALRCPRCPGLMEPASSFTGRICMRCGHAEMDPVAALSMEKAGRAIRAAKAQLVRNP